MRFQQTSLRGREMPAFLRSFGCVLAVVFSILFAAPRPALAAPATTTTSLSVASAGSPVTTVTAGSVVTLTATVTAGSSPVGPGQINFCDAKAKYCTDIHLLGTAQLTNAGTATLKLSPGVGSHSYKAVFVGTTASAASASTASALVVTGFYQTISTIAASGNPGNYTLTATVSGNGSASPTGTISFLDTSNSNQSLAVAPLTPVAAGLNLLSPYAISFFAGGPANFVVGDFNGDGIPDMASPDGDVSVGLGNGDGTFTPGIGGTVTPGFGFQAGMAAGDFNGDGKLDVAIASYNIPVYTDATYPGTVAVLLGDGGGGFAQVSTSPINSPANGDEPEGPLAIVTGDFNGDGNLDLAVVNPSSNTVTILLGHGDGTFIAAASPATGNGPSAIAVGDFNGDGKADLAVTNSGSNTVSILLSNGDGTFTAAASPATDKNPKSVAVGDFNGDGILDLAVANQTGNDVTILLGNGDGKFTAGSSVAITGPDTIAVGDFNGDGVADLAVGASVTAILLGNGDGTFAAPVASQNPLYGDQWVVAVDFNGDGRTDLAYLTPNGDDGYVTIGFSESQSATAKANNVSVSPTGLNLPTHLVETSYPADTAYKSSISNTTGLVGLAPFTLSGATNTQISILPGASGSTTVTVTPVAGFTGNVALNCSVTAVPAVTPLPTCSIAPSVTISGATAATATLTITAPAQATSTIGYLVTVTGASEGASETITYQQVLVPFGVFTITSTPVTVEAGSTGNSTNTITPSASFTGTVALQCAIAFTGNGNEPGCSIPPSVAISGTTTPVTALLAISPGLSTPVGDYTVTVIGTAMNGTNQGAPVGVTVPVTVTVGPNFTLSSTPVTIAPGGSGTSTLTVTPTLGFTGSVTLTCFPDFEEPDQPNCTSPAPVTISGTAETVAITVTTDAATASGTYMVEVDSPSLPGSLKHAFISVTVAGPAIVPAYTLTNTAVNIASPGTNGTSTITITPSGGFTGNVALACAVTGPATAIDPPTCAVPAQAMVTGTGAVTAMLTVYTTGMTMSAPTGYVAKAEKPPKRKFALGVGAVMSVLFFFGIPGRRRRWKTFLSLLIFVSIGEAVIGCGGKGNMVPANPGTTPGTYTVTVTGTVGATVQSTAVSVGVN
jgi:trimeric autotransporter adhesin